MNHAQTNAFQSAGVFANTFYRHEDNFLPKERLFSQNLNAPSFGIFRSWLNQLELYPPSIIMAEDLQCWIFLNFAFDKEYGRAFKATSS